MSLFCTQCGAQLSADNKFCPACGTRVVAADRSATETDATSPVPRPNAAIGSRPGKRRGVLVAGFAAGAVLVAALIVLGSNAPQTSPASPPATAAVPPVKAGPAAIVASRWERYTNTRYGVMIDVPADLFTAEPPPPDNAGRNFNAPDQKARFHIYSHANALGASRDELQAEDVLDIGDAAATQQSGDDWSQVVGVNGDNTILRRVLMSDGGAILHRLEIAYPTIAATAFAPVVARMTKSFRVDLAIPEKAAHDADAAAPPAKQSPEPGMLKPSTPAWQRFDSIALGLHIPNYRGPAGVSAEVPANWTRSDMPEPNVIEFTGPEAIGEDELHVLFRAERRRVGATLASEAKIIKTRLAEGADNYRLLSERTAKVALRPAILLSQQFEGSDSTALLREDVAIIDGGEVIYFVQFSATQARYATSSHVFTHVIETVGFAQ